MFCTVLYFFLFFLVCPSRMVLLGYLVLDSEVAFFLESFGVVLKLFADDVVYHLHCLKQ